MIATGTRWEPPVLPGIAPERVLTADQVTSLPVAPHSALVLGSGPVLAISPDWLARISEGGTRTNRRSS